MFQAKIISNSQNEKGDVETIIEYSSDNVKAFQEVIPSDANGSSVSNTIQNHLTQLQGAEDFVNANPAGTVIEATPATDDLTISTALSNKSVLPKAVV